MFSYQTLENTSIEALHEAFVMAFSDYQVKIDLPLWKFQNMLKRRGFVSSISMGAFIDNKLVGFILNGLRRWNGQLTVYDVGTGVIGEYRKQGITSSLFKQIQELLMKQGVEQYLLEVIQANTSALELYKKQNFKIVRSFSCFSLSKENYKKQKNHIVEHINKFHPEDWNKFMGFWDYSPSWQNSIDSVNSLPDEMVYSFVRLDDAIVGYGIAERKTGDIVQLAVNKNYRHKGIAKSIIADLIESTELQKVGVLNVDDEASSMKDFLQSLGFNNTVEQYEMLLKLK